MALHEYKPHKKEGRKRDSGWASSTNQKKVEINLHTDINTHGQT